MTIYFQKNYNISFKLEKYLQLTHTAVYIMQDKLFYLYTQRQRNFTSFLCFNDSFKILKKITLSND